MAVYDPSMAADLGQAFVPIAVARDQRTAERWRNTLLDAGIDSEIRIEDGAHTGNLGSAYGGWMSGQPFVYPVLVAHEDRQRAAAALVELGAESPFYPRRNRLHPGPAMFFAGLGLGLAVFLAIATQTR
jgi:hypothetical protein